MSNVPPPPPPPSPFPSAAPPPGFPPGAAQFSGSLSEPTGLRTATVALFGVSSALSLALAAVAYHRGGVFQRWAEGRVGLDRIDAADTRLGAILLIMVLAQLASIILLCLWSYRTVRNAAAQHPGAGLSPGLACGGWFIPIGNLFVPWTQLRRAAGTRGSVPTALAWWQALVIAQLVLSVLARPSWTDESPADEVVSALHRQGVLFGVAGLMLVASTILAFNAMRAIDAATSSATP